MKYHYKIQTFWRPCPYDGIGSFDGRRELCPRVCSARVGLHFTIFHGLHANNSDLPSTSDSGAAKAELIMIRKNGMALIAYIRQAVVDISTNLKHHFEGVVVVVDMPFLHLFPTTGYFTSFTG